MNNMSTFLCSFSLLLALVTHLSHAARNDYYWRDYTGEIPEDAVPGGLDKNGRTSYIGQVLIIKDDNQKGIYPVSIHKGNPSVTSEFYGGAHTTDRFIKILCSTKHGNFEWRSSKSTELHLTAIGQHLVPGGVEDGKTLNIGRILYEGQVVIGKVITGNPGFAKLFFPYDNTSKSVDSYQVLIFSENF